jgi:oxygen-independent coproporphyrinogen III oxidase
MAAALYLHIPFCRSKCPYCAFASCSGHQDLYQPYLASVAREINIQAAAGLGGPLKSIFVGGGTPTVLPASGLVWLLGVCQRIFAVERGAEITVEANPGTVDQPYLEALLAAGVNRLSLGMQTLVQPELSALGRSHTADQALAAFRAARAAGFANISLDLMYGIPGQTPETWAVSLGQALSLAPDHCSLYQLTVEPGTPLLRHFLDSTVKLPGEEEILEMDAITRLTTTAAGLCQYEIANYALLGRRCRHNLNYWFNGDCFAAGAAAVSYQNGVRERRLVDPEEYIRRIGQGKTVVEDREELSRETSFRETVIVGLRLVEGIERQRLIKRYGLDPVTYYGNTLARLMTAGFLALAGDRLLITDKGRPLSNQIMAELV